MIRINLLPVREKKKKVGARNTILILGVPLLCVLLGIAYSYHSLSSQIKKTQDIIDERNAEIQRLKVDTKDVEKFKAEKEDLQRRLNIIYTLQRAKTGPVRVLDDLAMAVPGKLWLTSMREKNGKMEIKGMAMDNETIARFMTNLEKSGVIKDVELVVAQQLEKKEIKVKEFTLTCQVNYASLPGGPPS